MALKKSNEVSVSDNQEKQTVKKKKRVSVFVLINLLQIAFFMAFTVRDFLTKTEDSKYFPYILVLVGIYLVLFVAVLVMSFSDKDKAKQLKGGVKDIKLATRVVKSLILLVNAAAAFLMVLESYSTDAGVLSRVFAVGAAAVALFNAIRGIVKTGRKVKKRVDKAQKQKQKQQA